MSQEEATRQCIETLRQCDGDCCEEERGIATALETGELSIVDDDLLRTFQAAGVLFRVLTKDGSRLTPTRFCHRLIDKVAPGIETIVDKKRLDALEKVLEKAADVTGILSGEPGMSCLQPLEDTLAELDALNGDKP